MINIFLEQPRRGKTHEVLITPYKRSAVWGLARESGTDCGSSDREKHGRSEKLRDKVITAVWGLTRQSGSDCGNSDDI